MCTAEGKKLGLTVECRQSNREGELVTWIQQAYGNFDGIIINPGGYSHTSVAIHDAISAVAIPTIEVHSQQHSRPRGIPPSFLCLCRRGRGDLRPRRDGV